MSRYTSPFSTGLLHWLANIGTYQDPLGKLQKNTKAMRDLNIQIDPEKIVIAFVLIAVVVMIIAGWL